MKAEHDYYWNAPLYNNNHRRLGFSSTHVIEILKFNYMENNEVDGIDLARQAYNQGDYKKAHELWQHRKRKLAMRKHKHGLVLYMPMVMV